MLIFNQCWKKLCCLIFFGTSDIFQDPLRNKKLKRTVFVQNINCVLPQHYYSKVWSQSFFSFFFFCINTFIQQGCVKWIKSDSKDLYCQKIFICLINAVLLNFLLA